LGDSTEQFLSAVKHLNIRLNVTTKNKNIMPQIPSTSKLPVDPKTGAQRNLNCSMKSVTFLFQTDRTSKDGTGTVSGLPSNIVVTGAPLPNDSAEVLALKATLTLAVEAAGLAYQTGVIALSEETAK
jgi:hypothetical protein